MTARLLSRFTRALFALWFVAMTGDTGALHACAMHGGSGHSHGASTSAAMATHASHHGGMSHSAGSSAGVNRSPDDAGQHGRTPGCTCLGECCATTVAAPIAAAPEVNVATVVAVPDHPLDLVERVAPATATLRLPFANGPPAA